MAQQPTPTVKLTCRIPADLHAKLVELAKDDMRPLSIEIIYLLREAVRRREQGQPPGVSWE